MILCAEKDLTTEANIQGEKMEEEQMVIFHLEEQEPEIIEEIHTWVAG
jgi:hypothetical protein